MYARRSRACLLLAALAPLLGCSHAPTVSARSAPRPPGVDASLGAGAVFDVRVFGEQELNGTYRVGPDGTIDYPFVGRVTVAGKLPSELQTELRHKLTAYVHDPQVSILVREMNSKRIIVYGQVQKPGTYPYQGEMTIVHAISLAGGFTAMAARNRVVISRVENEQQKVIEVDVREIAAGKAPNRFISPGDEVYVPESFY